MKRITSYFVVAFILTIWVAVSLPMSTQAAASGALELDGWDPRPGMIWDVSSGRKTTRQEVLDQLRAADVVLLGEKHDNSDQHRLQGEIIALLGETDRRYGLVWEMLPRARQAAVDRYLAGGGDDPNGFAQAINWEQLGWGDWGLYRPIAAAALGASMLQRAGGLARRDVQAVGKRGLAALPADLAMRVGDRPPLTKNQRYLIEEAVFEGHCGYVPRQHLGPMIAVQTARDLALADAALIALDKVGSGGGVIVVTGVQHARLDAGIPVHLAKVLPRSKIVSVGFIETNDIDHLANQPTLKQVSRRGEFDFIWFSDPGSEKAYCTSLAQKLGIKKDKTQKR